MKRLPRLRNLKRARDGRWYDTRRKRFISKAEHARRKKIQKTLFLKKQKPKPKTKKQTRKKVKFKTVEGYNIPQRVNFLIIDETNIPQDERIINRAEQIFRKSYYRLKKSDKQVFIKLSGKVLTNEIGDSNGLAKFPSLYTRTFDLQSAIADFEVTLQEDVNEILTNIRDQIGREFYEEGVIEGYSLRKISVSIRKPIIKK